MRTTEKLSSVVTSSLLSVWVKQYDLFFGGHISYSSIELAMFVASCTLKFDYAKLFVEYFDNYISTLSTIDILLISN